MKVLWLCNIVLPDFCEEFGLKKNVFGGWLTGMLAELEKVNGIEIGLVFPIIDPKRLKNGFHNKQRYYSFQSNMSQNSPVGYSTKMVNDFEEIIKDFQPDIVHIWGTEYSHTGAMVEACEKLNLLERTVINIQGLVSVHAKHYYAAIPEEYVSESTKSYKSIEYERNLFIERGKIEIEALKKVRHVIGRTDWDKACAKLINPNIKYHFCNEILRNEFYDYAEKWHYDKCNKHSIFVSQASYPIKGLHMLLEAMPLIIEKFPDAHIYVTGIDITCKDDNGEIRPYGSYLKSIISKYNLQDKITFLGRLNATQMCEQFLRSNVFVSASSIENSPNSVCEAMMIGTPVVSSDVGGVNSILTHKENALLYPYDAYYMLAYYVMEIFESEELAQKLSENGKLKSKILQDRGRNCNQNIDIYYDILKI